MQDEINEKVIALSIRTTKLTAEMLQKIHSLHAFTNQKAVG